MELAEAQDYQIICEIYDNSGIGDLYAHYTFELKKSFLGELKNPTKKSGEARTIASLEFETELCKDAKIYYTAYVASMTGRTQSKDANGGSTGWEGNANNSSPQTAPTLRFRVSTTRSGKNDGSERIPVMTFVTGNIRQEVQNANYDNGLFKEAQWYQVYGYTTITEGTGYNLFASSTIPRVYFVSAQGIVTRLLVEDFDLPE